MLGVIAGHDPARFHFGRGARALITPQALDGNVKGLKLGLPREYLKDMTSEIGQA